MSQIAQVRAALAAIAQKYSDTRICHCQMEAEVVVDGVCTLSGSVLDGETLTAVVEPLVEQFPDLAFATAAVQVLRAIPEQFLQVATNVTGLYANPSFLAEMVSQLVQGMGVERLQEQGKWVYVRQEDGYLGWVYGSYLGKTAVFPPTHLVSSPVALLHQAPDETALLVGRVLAGTAVFTAQTHNTWTQLTLPDGTAGWVHSPHLRSLAALPQTGSAQRQQLVQDAAQFIGVPYRWGGCTSLGLDCSGLAQLTHRLVGVILPRDADMQYKAGRSVEPPFQPGDLLFFGNQSQTAGRAITHVGISLGEWRMLHASIARNGVYEDDAQAVAHLRQQFVGARTFLRE